MTATIPFIDWTPGTNTAEILGLPKPPVPGSPMTPTAEIGFPWMLPTVTRRTSRARAFRTTTSRAWRAALALIGLVGVAVVLYQFVMATKPLGQILIVMSDGGFLQ